MSITEDDLLAGVLEAQDRFTVKGCFIERDDELTEHLLQQVMKVMSNVGDSHQFEQVLKELSFQRDAVYTGLRRERVIATIDNLKRLRAMVGVYRPEAA